MDNNSKSYGALFGSIIVILIIVLGGVYFLLSKDTTPKEQKEAPVVEEKTTAEDQTGAVLNALDALEQETNTNVSIDISDVQ